MRFSKKSLYAIRAVFDLSYHGGASPVQLRDVAERQSIPEKFLEQILGELKRNDLVISKRGPKGGYRFLKDPKETTLADILIAIDELPEVPESNTEMVPDLVCHDLVSEFIDRLTEVTIADLIRKGGEAGISRASYGEFVYVI